MKAVAVKEIRFLISSGIPGTEELVNEANLSSKFQMESRSL